MSTPPTEVAAPVPDAGPLLAITHRWTGRVLWQGHAVNMGKALEAAIAADANLSRANLSDADLSRANLSDANLSDADLSDADLSDADLSDADLSRANLSDADLSDARSDFFSILDSAVAEVPALLAAVREGRVDGSAYHGPCACLVGTIANARGVDIGDLPGIEPDSSRPAERFFLAIAEGDTPANNAASRIVETWILDWQKAHPVAEMPAT